MKEMVLVTGGCGYIGSHTVVQLLETDYEVVVLDNLCNSAPEVINRIETITGRRPFLVEGDIRDRQALKEVFRTYPITSIIHFAGLKAVGESEQYPLKYYSNNVEGSLILFEEMEEAGIVKIVFSSSATVYGDPGIPCYHEALPLNPINVYGRTKRMVEDIMRDMKRACPTWRMALLRYFNPVGAHFSGLIGESPSGTPNNLMPFISQVAMGKRARLSVFGGDYSTPDGTGLRDYLHVEDLARGHLAALDAIRRRADIITVNLGTGNPYSVLDMVAAFEKASCVKIPYEIVTRRAGDLAEYYADPSLAEKELGWKAQYGIDRMCEDTWRWQSTNPDGFS